MERVKLYTNEFALSEVFPAWEVFAYTQYDNNVGAYRHFVNNCVLLGMKEEEVRDFLSYQILLDYIISNTDRHMNNFGIIRDTTTLEPLRMAPIYDCGNSMFHDQMYVRCNPKMLDKIETCSFRKKEVDLLQYVTDFSQFDVSRLPEDEDIRRIYAKDTNIEEEKIEELIKIVNCKAERINQR